MAPDSSRPRLVHNLTIRAGAGQVVVRYRGRSIEDGGDDEGDHEKDGEDDGEAAGSGAEAERPVGDGWQHGVIVSRWTVGDRTRNSGPRRADAPRAVAV